MGMNTTGSRHASTPTASSRTSRKRAAAALLVSAMLLAGCGGERDAGSSPLGIGEVSPEQQRLDYADAMDRMRTALEDPSSPPIQQSIQQGNRKQLVAAAKRWDQATATAASITPPKDIAAEHKQLVTAMRQLGEWNRRIANAAPNKGRTRKLGKQAQKSAAAKSFGQAINRIESKGYFVMSDPSGGDPFAGAGDPVG